MKEFANWVKANYPDYDCNDIEHLNALRKKFSIRVYQLPALSLDDYASVSLYITEDIDYLKGIDG